MIIKDEQEISIRGIQALGQFSLEERLSYALFLFNPDMQWLGTYSSFSLLRLEYVNGSYYWHIKNLFYIIFSWGLGESK